MTQYLIYFVRRVFSRWLRESEYDEEDGQDMEALTIRTVPLYCCAMRKGMRCS